ncbi:hypothetical protein CSPB12327_08580, partial [Campylobacter sp. RM12327]
KNNVEKKFNIQDPKKDIQQNHGDYVSYPENIFIPKTWFMPGHGTENYGAAGAKKEIRKVKFKGE